MGGDKFGGAVAHYLTHVLVNSLPSGVVGQEPAGIVVAVMSTGGA